MRQWNVSSLLQVIICCIIGTKPLPKSILTPMYKYNELNPWASVIHDDIMKLKHFPRYWPFVRGIHRSPGNSPHKGQWRRAFIYFLICAWINGKVNNREAGDLRRYRDHYDVTVVQSRKHSSWENVLGLLFIILLPFYSDFNTSINDCFAETAVGTRRKAEQLSWYYTNAEMPDIKGPFYYRGLNLIPAWMCNQMPSNVWDEITYPFRNFNGCSVENWEWINNWILHFKMGVITYRCWGWS